LAINEAQNGQKTNDFFYIKRRTEVTIYGDYEVGATKKRKNEENRLNYAYFDAQLRENTL